MNTLKGPRPSLNTAFPPGSETALLSGRFGDYVYFVRNGKQFRRRYVVPTDRRTPGQLRTRATFGVAAKYWSHSDQLTDQERQAWETTANQVQSRPRLEQSGPLTGQQYFVACACKGKCGMRIADCGMKGRAQAQAGPQAARGQGHRRTTPEPRRDSARPPCGPGPAKAGPIRCGRQRLSIPTGPRPGAGREQRINIRRRPQAGRVHPACSSGAGMGRLRCGTRKVLAAQGLGEGWRGAPGRQTKQVSVPGLSLKKPISRALSVSCGPQGRPGAEARARGNPGQSAWESPGIIELYSCYTRTLIVVH